jgi:hypothetical protein
VRVTTSGPIGRLGAAALPVPARDARAYQSWGLTHGSPGTERIHAPGAAAVPQSFNRALHRSSDAPDVIYPALYYQHGRLAGAPPVSVISDNQMPVPAVDPRGKPSVQFRGPVFLGQQQTGQPKAVPSFPWRR